MEKDYLNLLGFILHAEHKEDRTGTGTRVVFGSGLRFDLQKGFPLLTTKYMPFKSIVAELLWFLSGSTNNNDLLKRGSTIWNEWADESGELGKIYGHQWRNFGANGPVKGFDQISWLINEIKTNPTSRRLYVTASNPQDKNDQALDTCHNYFQVVIIGNKLNLLFRMRSTDVFLGLPFNIASYALLAHMLANECGYKVGELVYQGCDVHLYDNHREQAKTQIKRQPFEFPQLEFTKKPFFEYTESDFKVINYNHHNKLSAPVAV
jgi:thymidylate synthase